jgi:hypothetical protein
MSAIKQETLEDGRIRLSGGTFPLKDQIRARGGKWDPAARVWTLPAGTDTTFITTVEPAPRMTRAEALEFYYTRVAPAMAAFRPPRRDGRCCDAAVAFWPSTDAYSHYGPCSYRCPHHGETRSTYSGT